MDQTFVLLKPDAAERGLEFTILNQLSENGIHIPRLYKRRIDEEFAKTHYDDVISERPVIGERLLDYVTRGPVTACLAEHEHAVKYTRELVGDHYDPAKCPAGTIRGEYGIDTEEKAVEESRAVENLVHASDSAEAAAQEIDLWFETAWRGARGY